MPTALPTYADCVRRFGLLFRPDRLWYEYVGHPNVTSPYEGAVFDGVVRGAALNGDPYAAALAVWREDGLITADDPGPPAFAAAHREHLARPQPPKSDVALTDLLAEVNAYWTDAHAAIRLGAAGDVAAAAKALNRAHVRLIDWLADHGLVVDHAA